MTGGRATRGAAALCAAAILLSAGLASAFTRSRDPETNACFWWRNRTVSMVLNENCSIDVPRQDCIDAVWVSLDRWNQPTCSDFQFVSGGTTSRTDVGFDEDHWDDNINLIIWQEGSWSHSHTAIALTTTTYDRLTGEIVDTDIEVNGRDYTFTTSSSPSVIVDICNTLTHEAGHSLGLDHSSDEDATMYGYAPLQQTSKCSLAQDDIDGLCHVYPAGEGLPPCEGFTPPKKKKSCSTAGAGTRLPALAILAGWLWLRRSRSREEER